MERTTGPHDLGGLAAAPVDVASGNRPWASWERQCHGVVWLLVQKGLMSLDELRRATEALPGYSSMSYYQKWAAASAAIAIERGTFSKEEWEQQLGLDSAALDTAVKFKPGDLVAVRPENPSIRWRRPHLRTPGYIFGLIGTVERCAGTFGNPELKAFREQGPQQPLYRVRFRQSDVWELYDGDAADSVDVEVYQPWLEPATAELLAEQRATAAAVRAAQHAGQHGAAAAAADPQQQHHHHHHHGEEEEEEAHTHEERAKVEAAAVELEGDDAERRRLAEALQALLLARGIITAEELRQEVEAMDARGTRQEGPRLVARAWVDPDFKQRLLQDAAAAAAELGISTSNFTAKPGSAAASQAAGGPRTGTVLTAVANEPGVHNLVVCTLCSCYPLAILGMSPHWYRSRAYRARAVRDPRRLLAEFGTQLPASTAIIRVHDSTADLRYMVIPERPGGTEGWSEEQLAQLVTRDSMIGVAPALTPAQLRGLQAKAQHAVPPAP